MRQFHTHKNKQLETQVQQPLYLNTVQTLKKANMTLKQVFHHRVMIDDHYSIVKVYKTEHQIIYEIT